MVGRKCPKSILTKGSFGVHELRTESETKISTTGFYPTTIVRPDESRVLELKLSIRSR